MFETKILTSGVTLGLGEKGGFLCARIPSHYWNCWFYPNFRHMTSKRSDTLRTWFGRIPSWCFTRMDQWTWFHGLGLDPLKPTSPSPGGTPSYHKWRGQRNPPKRASLQGLYISWKTSVSTQSCHFEHGFEDFFVWSTNHQKKLWEIPFDELLHQRLKKILGLVSSTIFPWSLMDKAIWFSQNGVGNRRLSCTFQFSNFKSTQISGNQNEPVWTLSFWEKSSCQNTYKRNEVIVEGNMSFQSIFDWWYSHSPSWFTISILRIPPDSANKVSLLVWGV